MIRIYRDYILKRNVKNGITICLYEPWNFREWNDCAITTRKRDASCLVPPLPPKATRQPSNCRNINEYYK